MTPQSGIRSEAGNLLSNGDFVRGLQGWIQEGPPDQIEVGTDLSDKWKLPGTHTAHLGTKLPKFTAALTQEFPLGAPAAEVQRVKFTGFFGTHRTDGEVIIAAFDKNGRKISELLVAVPHRPAKLGGNTPEGYAEISCESPTPPGTSSLRLTIRTGRHSGANDPSRFLFVHSLRVAYAKTTTSLLPVIPDRSAERNIQIDLQRSLQDLRAEFDLALAELAREQQARKEAETLAAQSEQKAKEAEAETKAARAELRGVAERLDRLSRQAAETEALAQQHRQTLQIANTERDALRTDCTNITAKLAEAAEQAARLEADRQGELESIRAELTREQQARKEAEARATETAQKAEEANGETKAERDALRTDCTNLTAKLAEAAEQAARYKAGRNQALLERDGAREKATAALQELHEARKAAGDVAAALKVQTTLASERDGYKKKVAEQAAELADLRARLADQEYRMKKVEDDIVRADAHLEILKDIVRS